ncbi:hypothetical protein C8J56DRAFT_890932 [Mycena floridula]|nr:hypothetical protein C8J56DRAFT_890932 [Mycena floridula]
MDTRSADLHERLPCEVLYAATIGKEPPAHPELQAIYAGMQTPCPNGFKMTDAIKAYPGGSSAYLGLVSSSHITSYNDIKDIITVQLSNDTNWATVTSTLDVADALGSFGDLFKEFLQGSGVPVPALWGDAKNHISDFINLADINKDFFRPRMFAWAATGTPELKRELVCGRDTIDIFLSSKDSEEYKDPGLDDAGRHAFAQLDGPNCHCSWGSGSV